MSKLEASVNELPFRDAVRYTPKDTRWTAQEYNVIIICAWCYLLTSMQTYVDNHADAMLDNGFRPGMSILNWMPEGDVKVRLSIFFNV